MNLNNNFIEDISKKSEIGTKWLEQIPQIIKNLEEAWNIKVGDPFNLSFNYVASATKNDGTQTVLKIVFPDDKGFKSEVEALQVFNGEGCIKLIEVSEEFQAMLLEKAVPGIALPSIQNDEYSTKILASVIKKLGRPVPKENHFTDAKDFIEELSNYKENFKGKMNPLPIDLLDKCKELLKYLIETSTELVVNHGDLHFDNVLSSTREPYLAIDPKGIIAEKAYETGAMLRNPYPELMKQQNVKEILTKRIQILAEELNMDPKRIQQWGFVQTVLSSVWRVEDYGTHYEHAIEVAEVLDKINI